MLWCSILVRGCWPALLLCLLRPLRGGSLLKGSQLAVTLACCEHNWTCR